MANLGIPILAPVADGLEPLQPDFANEGCKDIAANHKGCKEAWDELFGSTTGSCYQRCAGIPPAPKIKPPRPGKDPWPKSHFPCFAADSEIWTSSGKVRIADIKKGDTILGFDCKSREIVSTNVTEVIAHSEQDFQLNRLTLGDEDIWVTDGHPVFDGAKWELSHLLRGQLTTADGVERRVVLDRHVMLVSVVFNLKTDCGTYLVGKSGLVVSGVVQSGSIEIDSEPGSARPQP